MSTIKRIFGCVLIGVVPLWTFMVSGQGSQTNIKSSQESQVDALIESGKDLIKKHDWDSALKIFRQAQEASAGGNIELRFKAVYFEATWYTFRDDYESAARMLLSFASEVRKSSSAHLEFTIHNTVMMLRAAQNNLPAILLELNEMTRVGGVGVWINSEDDQKTIVRMKDYWHKAYYYRMAAERLEGTSKEFSIRYAIQAKNDYRRIARLMPDYQDSIAVLDGYFAALDHDKESALAAARKVHLETNHDIEDLYLASGAFLAGGDMATAERIWKDIENDPNIYIAPAIIRQWIKRDRAACKNKPAGFTPFHP